MKVRASLATKGLELRSMSSSASLSRSKVSSWYSLAQRGYILTAMVVLVPESRMTPTVPRPLETVTLRTSNIAGYVKKVA